MDQQSVARVYLKSQSADRVVVQIPGTKYELYLKPVGPVTPTPQGRVRGVIRCPVWKVDFVSAGGAYIEPLVGPPRRVQGHVTGAIEGSNSIVIDVAGQPIVGDLPPRWLAADIAIGTKVGIDVPDGATFDAVDQPAKQAV